jgi:hypothetical protein
MRQAFCTVDVFGINRDLGIYQSVNHLDIAQADLLANGRSIAVVELEGQLDAVSRQRIAVVVGQAGLEADVACCFVQDWIGDGHRDGQEHGGGQCCDQCVYSHLRFLGHLGLLDDSAVASCTAGTPWSVSKFRQGKATNAAMTHAGFLFLRRFFGKIVGGARVVAADVGAIAFSIQS